MFYFFSGDQYVLDWVVSRLHCGNIYQERISNCNALGLVDMIPYLIETRFYYGLLTSKLQDQQWNDNTSIPRLVMHNFSERLRQCVDNKYKLMKFLNEIKQNIIICTFGK